MDDFWDKFDANSVEKHAGDHCQGTTDFHSHYLKVKDLYGEEGKHHPFCLLVWRFDTQVDWHYDQKDHQRYHRNQEKVIVLSSIGIAAPDWVAKDAKHDVQERNALHALELFFLGGAPDAEVGGEGNKSQDDGGDLTKDA